MKKEEVRSLENDFIEDLKAKVTYGPPSLIEFTHHMVRFPRFSSLILWQYTLFHSESICDAIKQNESEFGRFNFHFSDWLYTSSFAKLLFTTDPIEIGQLVLKMQTVEGLQKQ